MVGHTHDVARGFCSGLAIAFGVLVGSGASGQTLYVSSDFSHEVLRYNAINGAFIDTFIPAANNGGLNQPHAILDRGSDVLVASFGTNSILRYDRTSGEPLSAFATGSSGLAAPVYLAMGPDENLYVASQASGGDSAIRSGERRLVDAFVSAGSGGLDGPSGFAFSPNGERLYVAGRYSLHGDGLRWGDGSLSRDAG